MRTLASVTLAMSLLLTGGCQATLTLTTQPGTGVTVTPNQRTAAAEADVTATQAKEPDQ